MNTQAKEGMAHRALSCLLLASVGRGTGGPGLSSPAAQQKMELWWASRAAKLGCVQGACDACSVSSEDSTTPHSEKVVGQEGECEGLTDWEGTALS